MYLFFSTFRFNLAFNFFSFHACRSASISFELCQHSITNNLHPQSLNLLEKVFKPHNHIDKVFKIKFLSSDGSSPYLSFSETRLPVLIKNSFGIWSEVSKGSRFWWTKNMFSLKNILWLDKNRPRQKRIQGDYRTIIIHYFRVKMVANSSPFNK